MASCTDFQEVQLRDDEARERKRKQFMDAACGRLGFCLAPSDAQRLMKVPPMTARDFVEAVINAEGIDPVHLESYEHYGPLMEIYRKFFPED